MQFQCGKAKENALVNIPEAINFLKEMQAYQASLAAKHAHHPSRAASAMDRASKIGQVIDLFSPQASKAAPRLNLLPEDLVGLPDELLQELSVTKSDFFDFEIARYIDEAGGVMTLDQLIITLYRKTGEIHERSKLNSRLYRMAKKNLVKSIEGRKGVYATKDVVIDDLFDEDQGEETPP
ncbi:hypothetical protein [Metapseudomonas otitidis]|uniref:hypothetical protein n=1 Tax=Metapseudomonas otitidis TaxID=319939 RepID=UPI001F40C1ED|nr:hypothetical protein [Pseudomonas otitidis]